MVYESHFLLAQAQLPGTSRAAVCHHQEKSVFCLFNKSWESRLKRKRSPERLAPLPLLRCRPVKAWSSRAMPTKYKSRTTREAAKRHVHKENTEKGHVFPVRQSVGKIVLTTRRCLSSLVCACQGQPTSFTASLWEETDGWLNWSRICVFICPGLMWHVRLDVKAGRGAQTKRTKDWPVGIRPHVIWYGFGWDSKVCKVLQMWWNYVIH